MATPFKIVQTPAVALYAGISATATSMRLIPYPVDLDGNKLAMTDFGTTGFCTVDPKVSSFEEIISFTGITDNGDGSATLTGLTRDLTSKYPYTTSGTGKLHGASAVVVFSDNPQVYNQYAAKANDEAITGAWTVPDPTAATQIANKEYVDTAATGSATYDQNIVLGVAGENLTSGNIIYFKSSDGKWYVADSATASKSVGVQLGIAQATVLSAANVNVLIAGLDKKQTGLTAGTAYYLGVTGVISSTKGANIRLIGRTPFNTTTQLVVDLTGGNPEVSLVDGSRTYVIDTGAANAYVATLVPAITAYKAGQKFSFKAINANTTTSTLNVNGLGAVTIKGASGGNLVANDILVGQVVEVEHDGTNFQMISNSGNVSVTQSGAQIYAADAGSNDTYVITLVPAATSYVTGMTIRFLANTINTGAATINVNGLGAKSIVKKYNVALDTGDIKANQISEIVYDGTNFQLLSPSSNQSLGLFKPIATTYDVSSVSGVQNIAHGLGVIPKLVDLTIVGAGTGSTVPLSHVRVVYDGTTSAAAGAYWSGTNQYNSGATIEVSGSANTSARQTGVITFDATNIIITWTKTGSPTGTAFFSGYALA